MVHKTDGCTTCKKRKIKCDLSRPGCQRCRRIGKDCPGYPNEWDLAFRDENQVVHAKVHKSREILSKSPTWSLSSVSSRSPSPRNALVDDIQLRAICLFFRDYIVTSCAGICDGFLDFLPDLYMRSSENYCLHTAVLAASYANMAHKTARKDLELKATSFYRTSLETVHNTLSDPRMATSDVTMTAVILLGLYECINNATSRDVSLSHSQGLGVLADLRGALLLQGRGPTLLQIACCQMQRRNIDLKLHPSPADERLVKLLDTSSPASRMIMNMFSVSIFAANTYQDLQSRDSDRIWNNSILQEFEKIDRQYHQWDADATTSFSYQTVQSSPGDELNSVFTTSEIRHHIYRGFWSASLWNKHRASRIILHQALLARLDAAKSNYTDEEFETLDMIHHRCKATLAIQVMIHDIFASIPWSLGDIASSNTGSKSIGGYFLVWALRVVLVCPVASEEQRNRARAALVRIGTQFGISHAMIATQIYSNTIKNDSETDIAVNRLNTDILAQ